jgi:hypothetical protein
MFSTSKDGSLFGAGPRSNAFSATNPQNTLAAPNPFQPQSSLRGTLPTNGFSSGLLSAPFGGAPATQSDLPTDSARAVQLLEKLTVDLASLHQKFDNALAAGQPKPVDRVYVACPLHPHVLLETTAAVLGSAYPTGYTCDACQRSFANKDEKFYQCALCPSPCGSGRFDVCANCVTKQLAK